MITPASVGDWALVGGLLGMLTGFATLEYRSILEETEIEPQTSVGSLFPFVPQASTSRAGSDLSSS
jgi:ADP-ribose pyrophosphatase YjhB (NUDIX family)